MKPREGAIYPFPRAGQELCIVSPEFQGQELCIVSPEFHTLSFPLNMIVNLMLFKCFENFCTEAQCFFISQ